MNISDKKTDKPAGWYEKYTVNSPKEILDLTSAAASSAGSMSTAARQGNVGQSILSGAVSGGSLGSLLPGPGTLIGTLAGAGIGAFQAFSGKKDEEPEVDPDIRESYRLNNELLKQKAMENQRQLTWRTKLRNRLKYR